MKKIIFTLLLFHQYAQSQNELLPFQWREHMPYNQAYSVARQGSKIFCAANECIFSYNESDNSYERLSKVNGLNDIEPVLLRNNPYNNKLLIMYRNSNMDIFKDGSVTNVPDLYRKQNIGDKTIYSVTFKDNLAYLACGFGIVVFDTDALEFKDTYIIGPGGTNLKIYQVAFYNGFIYAATAKGIYFAPLSSSNLSSFTNWQRVNSLPVPGGVYNSIVNFGNSLLSGYSDNITHTTSNRIDTIYRFDGTNWAKSPNYTTIQNLLSLKVSDNGEKLFINDFVGFLGFNLAGALVLNTNYGYSNAIFGYVAPNDIIEDIYDSTSYWEANYFHGLLKVKDANTNAVYYEVNGPRSTNCYQLAVKDNKVIAGSSFLGYRQYPAYIQNGPYMFKDETWYTLSHKLGADPLTDINCVAFDYNDKNHFYAGSFAYGLGEYVNDSLTAIYTYSNTNNALPHRNNPGDLNVLVTALYSDIDNNLWITTNDNPTFVTIKKKDGTWTSLDFSAGGLVPVNFNDINTNRIIVDSNNITYVIAYNQGLYVYKNDGSFPQPNASNAKLLTNVANKGGFPSKALLGIAQDKNRDVWVGTDQGIYVLYNPESIFTETNGWDAQPIKIQQDGITQLLLATDQVNAIAVDGANNKWCGTAASGLFCFSPDGQKQLYHFTKDNSPLFSNNILDVAVNGQTGEVFISTDKGIQSFQNTVTEGLTNFSHVFAYPNPVKEGYTGPILIRGLVDGSSVKIVDEAGNFVYETTSAGGQVNWNGQNFKGQRVASGVYLVICATQSGDQKALTKILFMR